MAGVSVAEVLKQQLRVAWSDARRALVDLTDEEYFWEPVEGCWSVHPRSSGVRGWSAGDFVCEDAWPTPDPLPAVMQ